MGDLEVAQPVMFVEVECDALVARQRGARGSQHLADVVGHRNMQRVVAIAVSFAALCRGAFVVAAPEQRTAKVTAAVHDRLHEPGDWPIGHRRLLAE